MGRHRLWKRKQGSIHQNAIFHEGIKLLNLLILVSPILYSHTLTNRIYPGFPRDLREESNVASWGIEEEREKDKLVITGFNNKLSTGRW